MRESLRCPTCRREARWEDNPNRPFCSERCRVIDLGNWAAERYRVPGEPIEPDDSEEIERLDRGGRGPDGSENDS